MELYHYIIIAIAVILVVTAIVVFTKKKQKPQKEYDLTAIYKLLDKDIIESIEYIRNKIVINFKDVNQFDTNSLHEKGALGITIVGDKVKFFFDGGNDINNDIFNQLKKHLER